MEYVAGQRWHVARRHGDAEQSLEKVERL